MDSLNEFFINYGYWGMALAAFLAGTFIPFSSEAVMGALLVSSTMDPVITVLSGTAGNVAGSMVNYYIGTFGSVETISKWLKVKEKRLNQAKVYVDKYGYWMGLLAWLPILGTAISIALGILRANLLGVFLTTLAGKLIRYAIVASSVLAIKY